MKFMLIQYDLDNDHKPTTSRKVFDCYTDLIRHQLDEHYATGTCHVWTVLASDNNGNFGSVEYQDKLASAIH